MPKVSVIIPTYNRAHYLQRAIDSVLNQTFQDFEIIIVDDASTDETPKVVEVFHDWRIRYFRHETNRREAGTETRACEIRSVSISLFWMMMIPGFRRNLRFKLSCLIKVQ